MPGPDSQVRWRASAVPGLALLVLACSAPVKTHEGRASAVKPPPADRADSGPAAAPGAPAGAAEAARVATRYVGVPYRWGGSGPAGFDCSGLVSYAFARVGIALPRTVAEQFRRGVRVSRKELRPGDVVFFDRLRHNGIYIGNGRFVHAARTGRAVTVSRLDTAWYRAHWVGARRFAGV